MKRQREIPEYVGFVRRSVRALARRVGDADPEDLAVMVDLRAELDEAITEAVWMQRTQYGRSWTEIGNALGITRQSAQERFTRAA